MIPQKFFKSLFTGRIETLTESKKMKKKLKRCTGIFQDCREATLILGLVLILLISPACQSGSDAEVDSDPATLSIVSVTPASDAMGVSVSSTIRVAFNRSIKPDTLTTAEFTVSSPSAPVAGTVTYESAVGTFTPNADLAFGTKYIATVSTGVTSSSGATLSAAAVWSFTTQPVPGVSSTNPADNATKVPLDTNITATFPKPLDLTTVLDTNFTLVDSSDDAVGGDVTADGVYTIVFDPTDASLDVLEEYTAYISTNLRYLSGSTLPTAYSWSFTTRSAPWEGIKQMGDENEEVSAALALNSADQVFIVGYRNVGGTKKEILLKAYETSGTDNIEQIYTVNPSNQEAKAVTIDSSGDIIITGVTNGTVFGKTPVNKGAFFTRFDSTGDVQTTELIDTSSDDEGLDITLDATGDIYITGLTNGVMGGGTDHAASDIFIAKFNKAETELWRRNFGTDAAESGQAIAVDSGGNIYITGYETTDAKDIFIAKYAATDTEPLTHIWKNTLGENDGKNQEGYDIAVDRDGNVLITGYTEADLCDGKCVAPDCLCRGVFQDGKDIYLAKYDPDGTLLLIQVFGSETGSSTNDVGRSMIVDASGDVHITGYTDGTLGEDGNVGGTDVIYAHGFYNSTVYETYGYYFVNKQYGTTVEDKGYGIVMDSEYNLFISGTTIGDFGGINGGSKDIFLLKVNGDGVPY